MQENPSLKNPFLNLFYKSDSDDYYGSRVWVDYILQGISSTSPQSMELIGLPNMGKSYLLRYLANPKGALLKDKDSLNYPFNEKPFKIFPLLVEFRLLPAGMHPFIYLYNRFHESYPQYKEYTSANFSFIAPEIGREQVSKSEIASRLLDEAITKLKEASIRPVFLFDDFDIAFARLNQVETTRLRPWRDRVSFILVTVRRLDKVNSDAAGSPFYQTLPLVRFGGLNTNEAFNLLSRPAAEAGWAFHPDDIGFILNLVDGHPFLLMQAGNILWTTRERLNFGKSDNIPVSMDFSRVLIGYLVSEFNSTFNIYWDHLDPTERETLMTLGNNRTLQNNQFSTLAFLEQRGLVKLDTKSKTYVLFSPLFADFIKELNSSSLPVNIPKLSNLEMNLYEFLKKNSDRVCTFEELSKKIWKIDLSDSSENQDNVRGRVQVTISRLRKKIQKMYGTDIISVREKGYRLVSL